MFPNIDNNLGINSVTDALTRMKVKTPFIAFADLIKPGNQRESCNLKRRLFQWKIYLNLQEARSAVAKHWQNAVLKLA